MDLHPDISSAAAHVRSLQGIRKNNFLTTKSAGRTAKAAEDDLATSLLLLKTDHVDLWQMHSIQTSAGSSVLPATSIPRCTQRC